MIKRTVRSAPVALFTAADHLRSFTRLIKTKSNSRPRRAFVSDSAHRPETLEMSRVNRGLNKARNLDYFVRIRHSVSEMGGRLRPLDAILREDKKKR